MKGGSVFSKREGGEMGKRVKRAVNEQGKLPTKKKDWLVE